jgi:hypothetical protein
MVVNEIFPLGLTEEAERKNFERKNKKTSKTM